MTYLTLTGIQKQFPGGVVAVHDFNLSMETGEFVSLLGPSGCGKTTTLRMIAGFEQPTRGSIVLAGTDITDQAPNQRNIGMVFQSYALFSNMTVSNNVGFGLRVRKRPADQIRKRVQELLDLVHLSDKGGRFPYQLSGGQQQRVALARALAYEPQVLLLDEPLSALDAKIRVSLRTEIRAIQQQLGITTVYVTHDQEEALSLSDRIVVMSEGRIEQIGTPFEVYNTPSTPFVARFVGTLSTLTARVVDGASGRVKVGDAEITAEASVGATGSELALALRPEVVRLGESGGSNRLVGRVHDVAFLGSVVRIRVELPGNAGILSLDTFNEPDAPPPVRGTRVTLSFPPSAVMPLDARAVAQTLAAAEAF